MKQLLLLFSSLVIIFIATACGKTHYTHHESPQDYHEVDYTEEMAKDLHSRYKSNLGEVIEFDTEKRRVKVYQPREAFGWNGYVHLKTCKTCLDKNGKTIPNCKCFPDLEFCGVLTSFQGQCEWFAEFEIEKTEQYNKDQWVVFVKPISSGMRYFDDGVKDASISFPISYKDLQGLMVYSDSNTIQAKASCALNYIDNRLTLSRFGPKGFTMNTYKTRVFVKD